MRMLRFLTIFAAASALLAGLSGPATAGGKGGLLNGALVYATLDGFQEVDDETGLLGAGDLGANGFAIASIHPHRKLACYRLAHDVDPEPFAFHIHAGVVGTNGPIVVDFFTEPGEVVPPAGCVRVDRKIAWDILANPDHYYFNAHNEPFPAGAIRGQLTGTSR